jgi:serine/threonine-protein kinase
MMAALHEGMIFSGRYRIVRCLATGGMGAVYEAIHVETERRRALKVMLPHLFESDDLRERFKREARISGQVESEYIVDVSDAGVDAATGMPFLVMELLRGEDLSQRLKRVGRLPPGEVLTYLQQAALGLDRTHAAAIVHRDLKPQNLFLTQREDGSPLLKILDFGIAKVVAQGTTAGATQSLGTPLYMAPEQFRTATNLTPAVDIYALGMVAYTLMVGKAYWSREAQDAGNLIALAMAAVQGPIEPATQRAAALGVTLPPSFDAWFTLVTAAHPAARFPTAGEAVRALAAALGAAPAPVHARERPNAGGGTVLLEGTTATSAALTIAPAERRARPLVLVAALALTAVGVGTWIGLRALGHGAAPAPAMAPAAATESAGASAASATTKSSSSPSTNASPPVVEGTAVSPTLTSTTSTAVRPSGSVVHRSPLGQTTGAPAVPIPNGLLGRD